MPILADILRHGVEEGAQQPWPRFAIDRIGWARAGREMARGVADLVALWSCGAKIHLALRRRAPQAGEPALVVLSFTPDGSAYPSIGAAHAPAQRMERALRDLYGFEPVGLNDARGWLDHGVWDQSAPCGLARAHTPAPAAYAFAPVEGEGLHIIPVGPIHAGIIEPGHFRFTANGEAIARLEERLGYMHRGAERALRGADLDHAARIAARLSGDSTLAYSLAFARAVEAALGLVVPPRAQFLRGLMAEIERIANHLGDIGAICNDAAFSMMLTHCAVLREQVLRASKAAFSHRLMMDVVIPGGCARDMTEDGANALRTAFDAIEQRLPDLWRLYDHSASLQDRVRTTGHVPQARVARFAAGGFVGRASGRAFDARADLPYAPYDSVAFKPFVLQGGDVDARVLVRRGEIEHSLLLARIFLDRALPGPIRAKSSVAPSVMLGGAPSAATGAMREGASMVEGFRGDIFAWVRIDAEGRLAAAHLRDPSQLQWPLLETAVEGCIVADFPLCNKSFNCSYAGADQ
jgi:Ni,Fe-hydrogenase III large subunit